MKAKNLRLSDRLYERSLGASQGLGTGICNEYQKRKVSESTVFVEFVIHIYFWSEE